MLNTYFRLRVKAHTYLIISNLKLILVHENNCLQALSIGTAEYDAALMELCRTGAGSPGHG